MPIIYNLICHNPHCDNGNKLVEVKVSSEGELTSILNTGCSCGGKLAIYGNPEEVK